MAEDALGLLSYRIRSADAVPISYVMRDDTGSCDHATTAAHPAVPICFAETNAERIETGSV